MSGWQIQLLGNTVLHLRDDLSITISDPHARALLAYLALERETPHRRRDLIALLWSDVATSQAADLLQATLKILSNALNSTNSRHATLDHTHFRVSLRLDDDLAVDVDRFRHALVVSERHPHSSLDTCASCHALLSHADSLYQGDFLEGLELPGSLFANWLLDQRNDLHDQAMHVFWALAENDIAHNRFDSAITNARKQLVLDPWHIPSHAQLMNILSQSGRTNEALTHYEAFFPRYRAAFKRPPDLDLTALYDRLRSTGKPKTLRLSETEICPDPDDSSALPFPSVPIVNVGREVETAQTQAWLGDPAVRLVMLTGPGGIGKTHLALNAAQLMRGKFTQGVAYVPLLEFGECTTDDLNALVVQRTGEGPGSDRDMLLILDNAEVVRGALDTWILDFLGRTQRIKLLICTQFPLDVPGKRYALGYLPVPTHVDNSGAQSYASVRMFEVYAHAANPSFELDPGNVPAVVQICHAVAGLPLGIQLAAMWISQFSPAQLANALNHDLDAVISPNDSLPERHRSLRALFYRTLNLLSARERNTLLQCSVFAGDFDLDAAQQIIIGETVLDDIDMLIQYGLVLRAPEERFILAPTIAVYAQELLSSPDLVDSTQLDPVLSQIPQRHSAYFRIILHNHIEQWRKGTVSLHAVEHELENIRVAWHWLERHASEPFLLSHLESWLTYLKFTGDITRGIEVCDKLSWYLKHNLPAPDSDRVFAAARQRIIARLGIAHVSFLIDAGRYTEVDEILARTVQQVTDTGDSLLRAQLSLVWGDLFSLRGDYTAAQEHLSQVWRLALSLSSPELTATNLLALGTVSLMQNNEEMAYTYYEQGLELSRSIRWRWIEGGAQNAMGLWQLFMGAYGLAQEHIDKAWFLAQDLGASWLLPEVQYQQGLLSQRLGKLDDARTWYEHALSLSREHQHRRMEILIMTGLAGLFFDRHENEAAMQTAQQAIEPAHIAGLRAEEADAMLIAARILEADHQIDYALEAYQRVFPIYETLGKTDEIPVVQAGIARCEEARGYHDQAVRLAERIVYRLRNKGHLLAMHEPMHIYCTCYDILVHDNAPRAVTVLRLANDEMQKQAKSIRDPQTRAGFLNKVAANRDIANRMQLYDRHR